MYILYGIGGKIVKLYSNFINSLESGLMKTSIRYFASIVVIFFNGNKYSRHFAFQYKILAVFT